MCCPAIVIGGGCQYKCLMDDVLSGGVLYMIYNLTGTNMLAAPSHYYYIVMLLACSHRPAQTGCNTPLVLMLNPARETLQQVPKHVLQVLYFLTIYICVVVYVAKYGQNELMLSWNGWLQDLCR